MGARKNRLFTLEKKKQNQDLSYGPHRSKISLQPFGQSLHLSCVGIINYNNIYEQGSHTLTDINLNRVQISKNV